MAIFSMIEQGDMEMDVEVGVWWKVPAFHLCGGGADRNSSSAAN